MTLPTLHPDEWWVMATGALCAGTCGLVGCYLVLRRLSMLGDAITHAILPGLAGAFLLTGSRSPLAMLAGALVVGLATAGLSAGLTRAAKVKQDAALGVVFTTLFALGVLMITQASSRVDLDPDCVLYGMLDAVALDTTRVLGVEVPRAFAVLAGVGGLCVLVFALLHKEIKLVAFDPALASSMGFAAGLLHYGLIGLIAATSVASFEAVGSILVVAMLVGPAVTASLLTRRYALMLFLASGVGVLSAVLGTLAAVALDTNYAGAMSVAVGALFTLALLFSPSQGLLPAAARRLSLATRVRAEDVLGCLYRLEEPVPPREGAAHATRLLRGVRGMLADRWLRSRGLVQGPREAPALTQAGRARAATILQGHRLWESYLATDLQLPQDHLHEPSERMEHFLTPALRATLRERLGRSTDPQGKPIPRADDEPPAER